MVKRWSCYLTSFFILDLLRCLCCAPLQILRIHLSQLKYPAWNCDLLSWHWTFIKVANLRGKKWKIYRSISQHIFFCGFSLSGEIKQMSILLVLNGPINTLRTKYWYPSWPTSTIKNCSGSVLFGDLFFSFSWISSQAYYRQHEISRGKCEQSSQRSWIHWSDTTSS